MDEKPLDRFPDFLRTDIAEAIRILSGFGAQRIYLFGSSVTSAAKNDTAFVRVLKESGQLERVA